MTRKNGAGWLVVCAVAGASFAAVPSCSTPTSQTVPQLSAQALANPESCRSCHESAVREWEGSMHAYASEDPIFVAMNRKMLREAKDVPKDTCTRCHAPYAARLGLLPEGTGAESLPTEHKGVTCIFCHSIDAVTGVHGGAVRTASDGLMQGGLRDPSPGAPHAAAYSALHDRESRNAASACGACHDVVTPKGDALERTYAEWQGSVYGAEGPSLLTCGNCHMEGRDGQAATTNGSPVRRIHDHSMPGVDVALTPFPHAEEQKARVQAALDAVLLTKLCVRPSPSGVDVDVTLDNAFAGHDFPSGATHDRRVWVSFEAKDGDKTLLASGQIPTGKALFEAAKTDKNLWILGDTLEDERGKPVLFLWEGAKHSGTKLPPAITNDPRDPRFVHSVTKVYGVPGLPTTIRMRVFLRAVDVDVLDALVASGDLAADVPGRMPTMEIRTAAREWTKDKGFGCVGP